MPLPLLGQIEIIVTIQVTGFNVGINAGASAGQTVFHVHVHMIPRRDGDVVDPRGGVRGVIPSKQGYYIERSTACSYMIACS